MPSVEDNPLFLALTRDESLVAATPGVDPSENIASVVDLVTERVFRSRPLSSLSSISVPSSISQGIPPTIPASTITDRNAQTPRKRDKAARVAKYAAKRTGFALSIALGAALFPITIPLYIYLRSRWKAHQGTSSAEAASPPASYLGPRLEAASATPSLDSSLSLDPIPYHSSMLRAELPGPAELAANSRAPNMALVSMATGIDYYVD
jgi:hypothetical protein